MNFKGQVSFEALFITLIILSSAMYMTGLYLQTQDITIATVIARADTLQQLNSFEDMATINEVKVITVREIDGTLTAEINISTNPKSITLANFDNAKLEETKAKILNSTKFSTVNFKIND